MIKKRLHTFDFLRGFFIILALIEHYTYYLNFLFIKYYKDDWYVSIEYELTKWVGPLPTDSIIQLLGFIFISWVSQVYLALASLNLTMTLKKDKAVFIRKLKMYLLLFIIFTIEKMIVSANWGEFLSLDPIQNWMVVLSGISISLYYLGKTATFSMGVIIGLSVFVPALNDPFLLIERNIQEILPGFSLESRPQIFIISALIGAWFGEKMNTDFLGSKKHYLLFPFLITLALASYQFAPSNSVSRLNIMYYEYDWSFSAFGSLYIWSIISLVFLASMFLEKRGISVRLPVINFIGQKSLWYFVFHRIFFLVCYLPARILFSNYSGVPIQNNILEVFIAISIYTLLFYYGRKFIHKMINQEPS